MTLQAMDIAASLRGRKTGKESWMVKCPAHEDKKPSCSVTQKDGKILVHCWAGCPQDAVISALRALGLWHTKQPRDQAIVWEAPMPNPMPWAQALTITERLVWQVVCLHEEIGAENLTYAQIKAFLDEAAQVSYHTTMRVAAVISGTHFVAAHYVNRWMSRQFNEALHEARP